MSAGIETLRQHCGLEHMNVMKIVAAAAGFVRRSLASGKKATADLVRQYLVDSVNWGAASCPDTAMVHRHMTNWATIEKSRKAKRYIEAATFKYGRGNMLDYPTKLSVIVGKTDPASIGFVVESLFVDMCRKGPCGPLRSYGVEESHRRDSLAPVVHKVVGRQVRRSV